MRTVVAAIDDSDAAEAVLTAALEVAPLFDDDVRSLTVCAGNPPARLVALADTFGLPLDVRHGAPIEEIAAIARDPDVAALVVASKGASPDGAVGRTARALLESVAKPVIVVPPAWKRGAARTNRVFVPLDGTLESAAAIGRLLDRVVAAAPVEVVALHVFDAENLPLFSDHNGHEVDAWSREFAHRWLSHHRTLATVESRVGDPSVTIPAAAAEVGADIVALAWKQDLSEGRARVITALLNDRQFPLVLVPVEAAELSAR